MKTKNKVIFLTALAIFGVFFVLLSDRQAKAEDADIYRIFVDAGAVPPGDGTRDRPYLMMNQALDELRRPTNEKNEVWIAGTHYSMALDPSLSGTPEQPLIFKQWEGKEPAIFDHRGDYGSTIITGKATDLVFDGISARNATGSPGGLPLFIVGSQRVTVMNGDFSGGEEAGTCLAGSSDIIIKNNVFHNNNGSGLLVPSAQNVTITNNVFRENGGAFLTSGVFVSQSRNVIFEENTISNNFGMGVNATLDSQIPLFNENVIFGNAGIGLNLDGIDGSVAATNNHIVNNDGIGISVRLNSMGLAKIQMVGNVLMLNHQDGLKLYASSPLGTFHVVNNTILSNDGTGISMMHSDSTVRVFNNVIAKHGVGASFNTSSADLITSNFNDLYGNEVMLQFSDKPWGPWSGWQEWQALGKDGKSLNVDPNFNENPTCYGEVCVNYHLQPSSPLRDAGRSILSDLPTDIDGDARTIGRLDIGADEVVQ